jgi:hypothetical protein
MGDHRDLAVQAAHEAGRAAREKEAIGNGLAAVTFALLEVADAIREASSKQ